MTDDIIDKLINIFLTNKVKKILFIFVFAFLLSGCTANKTVTAPSLPPTSSLSSPTSAQSVPLPTGEDIIYTFFELIREKRIADAVSMFSSAAAPDESAKQTWAVNFNTLESISVKSIAEWQKTDWTENIKSYKIIVIAKNKPNPQFRAWEDGENTRWINLIKENNLWKISEIATGP